MKKNRLFAVLILLLSGTSLLAQKDNKRNTEFFSEKPCCDCDSLWKNSDVAEFVQLLEKATNGKTFVWPGYDLSDATIIVSAGITSGGKHCVGLWKNARSVSYAQFNSTLRMLTPLYSYYLRYKGMDSLPDEQFFTTAKDAPAFENWMKKMGVSSAVYLPVDFSKLPFKIPTIVKLQLAIHEAFHVEVMLKYWYTKKGNWPIWDKQPDRKGLQACYTHNDSARIFIQKELGILADMVEALLDRKKEKVCSLGNDYLTARESRYTRLKDVTVKTESENMLDCRAAESLMELEEGLADYASWIILYNKGMVSKEQLLNRYRAKQNDHFYLSGCMLMHAITLMSKEPAEKIINKIVNSSSVEDGSLLNIFKETFQDHCNR